jgi:predicted nucleotidyltransferase component of viral defense system
MLSRDLAENFSAKLKIAVEQIVREEFELSLLKSFFESEIGRALVFKGGTALRLAYGSPRFSDDLDFSAGSVISETAFKTVAEAAGRNLSEAKLVEALAKYYTLFALYRVDVSYIGRPFSIKVEISTREESRETAGESELRLLSSEVTNLTVLARVATLERAFADKTAAFAARRQPRDLFDLWFLSQKLGRPFQPDITGLDPRIVRRELRKYLPKTHWSVIDQWAE